jgi:O-antigen/teichoic acid export membrane protein
MPDVKRRESEKALAPRTLAIYGLAKALPGFLMFVSVPIWIRLYGSANYGVFAVIWGTVLFSSSLGTGWLRQAVLKFAGSPINRLTNIASLWIVLSVLLCGIPSGLAVWVLRGDQSSQASWALGFSAVGFAIVSAIYYIALAVAQRDQRAGAFTLAEGLRAAATLASSLLLPILVGNYSGTTLVLANLIGTIVGCSVLFRRGSLVVPRRRRSSSRVLRAFWAFGWPMGIWQAIAAATLYTDRFFITMFLGPTAAGTYAALADLLVRGLTILSYPIIVASHPVIMRAWNTKDHATAINVSRVWTARLSLILLMGVFLGSLACIFLGELVLGISVSNSPTLWLIAVGAGCWQLSLMTHKGLEMVGRPRLMLLVLAVLIAVTLPINALLIPLWGTVVAAGSFAFSSLTYCIITYVLSRRILRSSQAKEITL